MGRGWAVEPFFEFDVQEIHEANLANEYSVLANLFFCDDLSLVKRSDGPNWMMSEIAKLDRTYRMWHMLLRHLPWAMILL